MTLDWHDIEGEMLIEGDYSRVLVQEAQRQVLLLSQWNLWICDFDTLEVKHMLALDSVVVHSAQLDAAGQRLYIGTQYGNTLLTVDLHSLQVLKTVLKTACRSLKLSSNRQHLYWLSSESMTLLSLEGKKPRATRQISFKGKERGWCLALSQIGRASCRERV